MTTTNGTEIYKPPLAQYGIDSMGFKIIIYTVKFFLKAEKR